MDEERPFWFEAKHYGLGWSLPVTWQGWATVLVYLALLAVGIEAFSIPQLRWPYIAAITVLLIAVVVWKGERPVRWRWDRR